MKNLKPSITSTASNSTSNNPTDSGEQFKRIMETFNRIDDIIQDMCVEAYKNKIQSLDDELLGFEFSDSLGGDECNEFETLMYHYGRTFVEERLVDRYSASYYERFLK